MQPADPISEVAAKIAPNYVHVHSCPHFRPAPIRGVGRPGAKTTLAARDTKYPASANFPDRAGRSPIKVRKWIELRGLKYEDARLPPRSDRILEPDYILVGYVSWRIFVHPVATELRQERQTFRPGDTVSFAGKHADVTSAGETFAERGARENICCRWLSFRIESSFDS